ncbi:MAG: ricin-type beta-trefoil lectin domain protein [Pseudolysinimonas sp.]
MSERLRTPIRTGIIAAIVAFSVIAGTVGSYAYWSATSQATLGTGAATLATTATGWATTVLGNENVSATSSNTLTSTGSVTITNTTSTTSSQSQLMTATFSRASGSTVLAGATTLTVWSVANTAACTAAAVPTSPTSALWSAGVVVSTTLAPGASVVYCLRNTIADRQQADDPSGTLTFTPQVAATLSINNFSGGSTTSSTISTQFIYPLQSVSAAYWYYIVRAGTTWCWDVSGSGNTSGSLLISYACKNNTDTNQDFRFMDADADGYGDFQPRHATNLRVAAATSTTTGSAVDMRTAATTTAVQQWQPQLVAVGTYQFVNKYSGLCLSLPAVSTGVTTQVTCNGGADQKFTFTQRAVIQLIGFTCSNIGGTGANRSVQYAWTTDYTTGTLTIQSKLSSSGTWTTLGTTAGTTFAFASPVGAPFTGTTGTYNVQVLNSNNDVVATDNITVSNSFFGFGYNYAQC